MQSITPINHLSVTPLLNESTAKEQTKTAETAQTTPQTKPTKAIIHQPPIRIRPIDDPIKWLKLLEGTPSVAINELFQKVLQLLQQNRFEKLDLQPLLAICKNDPARLAVVLRYGKNRLRQNGSRRDQSLIDDAAEKLEQDQASQINGGLNTAAAMAMYTSDGELLQDLRNTYYNTIIGKRSVNALFNAMVDLLGETQLPAAMVLMQKALNDDLMSGYPSIAPTPQLNALMTDSAIVASLTGLFGLSRDLLNKINRFIGPSKLEATELTRRMVILTTSSFYLRELQRLNTDAVGDDPLKQLVFLNYFYPLMKRLPDILWSDQQQRNNTLLSMLRFMDQQTQACGDYRFKTDKNKSQQTIKAKLTMQAGVPVVAQDSQREKT